MRVALLVLYTIVTTCVLMELGLRILGYHPISLDPKVWEAHPVWGWTHRPGASELFHRLGFRQHIEINSKGLRERDLPYAKPPGVFRVLVLGDSRTVGFEVPAEEVFTRVAEGLLREDGHPVEFINAGCRGWGTDQSLLFLRDEGVRYAPDLVLYYFNRNDPDNNLTIHKAFRRFGKSWFELGAGAALELRGVPVPEFGYAESIRVEGEGEVVSLDVSFAHRARIFVRDHSAGSSALAAALLHTLAELPYLMAPLRRAGGTTTDAYRARERALSREVDPESYPFRLTSALVGEMRRVSEQAGARFLMIGNRGAWPDSLREANGLPLLDDLRYFHEAKPEGAATTPRFDTHWNRLGHELYGGALARTLIEIGALPERGAEADSSISAP